MLQVLPTSDNVSISIWDAPSADELLEWLNTNLQYDAAHAVHEVGNNYGWTRCACIGAVNALTAH